MRKKYIKPMMAVEPLKLDHPIDANCNADYDDIRSLIDLSFFWDDCNFKWQDTTDGMGHDTVCYHSNVRTAFTS